MADDGTVNRIKTDFERKSTGQTGSDNGGTADEGNGANSSSSKTEDGDNNTKNPQEQQEDQVRTKPKFYTLNDGIKITWESIENSQNYKVHFSRKRTEEFWDFNTKASQYLLKQNIYNWITGEVVKISINAATDEGEVNIVDEEYVVGGTRVPSNVELKYKDKEPYDTLHLIWQKPKANAERYLVAVCKVDDRENMMETSSFETSKREEIIENLDPLTTYYCKVAAIYSNETNSESAVSNTLQTQDLPPETFKAHKVQIDTDSQNPSRQITVKWEITSLVKNLRKKIELTHFEVYLLDRQNNKSEVQKIDAKLDGKYQCCFKYLKSNATYKASVTTCKKHGKKKKSKEEFSNEVTTAKAHRIPGFNIEDAGKPVITICGQRSNKQSKFEWDLADLRIEKFNYKLLHVGASLKLEGESEIILDVENSCKCKPVQLKHGKKYTLTVQCTYLDLDKNEEFVATAFQELNTDIDCPKIENITCVEKQITVIWSKAKGAESYVLKILDENQPDSKELFVSGPQLSRTLHIPMHEHYGYGNTCTFVLQATAKNGKMTEARRIELLGGDSVVTNVTGRTEGRQFIVSWNPPKQNAVGYKLFLFELSGPNLNQASLCDEVSALERTKTSYTFTELKSSTSYCCHVSPIYRNQQGYASLSNTQTTVRRAAAGCEKDTNFGITTVIHKATEENNAVSVTLSWRKVEVGPNYKLTGYRASLKQIRGFGLLSTTALEKPLAPGDTQIIHNNIAKGYKFDFKLHAIYKDLDTGAEDEKISEHSFLIKSSEANVDCTWKEGVIIFKWKPVGGATKYRLIIKDELQKENLVKDKIIYVEEEGGGCEANIQMSDQIGIGRTCVTKVIAYIDETENSTSDWKVHLIGGVKVARNVQASTNNENPCRAVNISFDSPKHGNSSMYKIIAMSSGRKKTIFIQSSLSSFEYLRKGVEYKFEVWAKWDDDWFGPSVSNSVFTMGDGTKPMVEISAQSQAIIDLKGAEFKEENRNVTILQGDNFGCIMGLNYTYREDPVADLVTLNWTEPAFGNKRSDYKIEKFKIEIRKLNASDREDHYIEYDKSKQQYSASGYRLDLSELYNIHVYTIYEDIDQDVMYVSNAAELSINTRPCQPRIHRNHAMEDSLKIEWSKVKGTKIYEVDLFVENLAHPFTSEVSGTSYTKTFDETFGFGTRYYVVVRACGEDGKYNESKTESKVIGGDRVPTNVEATIEHEKVKDPNFQVFLKWTAPERSPKQYQIEVISEKSQRPINGIVGETYLVEDLRAGTEYYFKVKAKHDDGKVSGGCCSNKIKTNPTPTQVKRVWFQPGDNPSTSQIVFWEKVEAERENETTEYRIRLKRYDEKKKETSKKKALVHGDHITFRNLDPGALYSVTVAGGNSLGFGRESEEVAFTTEWGTPKNIMLSNNKTSPSSSLIITFDIAEGDVLHYMGTLYKCQNKAEQQIQMEKVESPQIFENLDPNSEYIVRVHAVMKDGTGKDIPSNKATTAPSKATITHYECCKDEDGELRSNELYARWRSDRGCDEHEVIIRCGTVEKPEYRHIISNENEIKYLCKHEAHEYSIQVRSRNCSGLFGDESDRVIVQLAPAKLKGATAVLTEESHSIKVSCKKPLYHSAFYLMNAFCGKKLVSKEPEKKESQDTSSTIEWIFIPTEFAEKYSFELWAEDSAKIRGKKTRTLPIISRPSKVDKVSIHRLAKLPSTDIAIKWNEQPRCNTYEVQIKLQGEEECENVIQCAGTNCVYRCLSPGDEYAVFVRAICEPTQGFWSDPNTIRLAPSEIEWIENADLLTEPVESITLKWRSSGVRPDGYLVRLYDENKQLGKDIFTDKTEHEFTESLESGSLRYCTVAAYNNATNGSHIIGTPVKSRDYRIKWTIPQFFSVYPDENEPTRKAQMKWKCPKGVNHFKLEIQNDKTGDVITQNIHGVNEDDEKIYTFSYGIPGNPYSVKLFSGCNGRYNEEFLLDTIIFKPDPPADITVVANKEVKGLSIEYRDSPSSAKSYRITIEPLTTPEKAETITTSHQSWICRNLTPGERYKVSVITIIEGVNSKALTTNDYIYTFPDKVKNLRSSFEEGNIKFEWDPLKIKPDEYIVQWRVNNESITEERTEDTDFSICCVTPATWYRLRVMACSDGNRGPMSHWETFVTRPSPPHSVTVKKDERCPETCLIVRFEDEDNMHKSYKVTAWFNEKAAKVVMTKKHFALLKDLTSGTPYIITVQTIFYKKESDIATVLRI